jgi:multidrug efflux pump subunit AcrA (membrane-fusion protein)
MAMRIRLLLLLALVAAHSPAWAQATFTVAPRAIADEKSVFATVESPNVVPARTRIGGTVASLSVRQGDAVQPGQVIAVVADDKLILQIGSLDAQIAGLNSQKAQAETDLARAETLYRQGVGPRTTMDQARTALEVATAPCARAPRSVRWRSRISKKEKCWRRSPGASLPCR